MASAAPFRLVNGYPTGLLDPNIARADRAAARAGSQPAHALHPAVQLRRAVRVDDRRAARRRVRRQQGDEAERLPQSQSARGDHRTPNGSQSAGARPYPGVRRHSMDGESRRVGLQLAADAPGEALLQRVDRRSSATRGARRSPTRPITSRPAAAAPASTPARSASRRTATTCGAERGLAEFDITHRFVASYVWELPFGRGRRFGNDWNRRVDLAAGRLAADGHSRAAERTRADGDARRLDACSTSAASGARVRTWSAIRSCPNRSARSNRWFNTDAFAGVQPVAAGVRQRRRRDHARPGIANFDFTLAKNFTDRRAALLPVPHRVVQRVQSRRTSVRRTSRATRAASGRS